MSHHNAELNRWVRATGELPGLARIVAATTVRTMAWTAGSYIRSGRLLARALTDRQAADQLLQEVAFDVAVAARTVSNVARAVADGVPVSRALLDGGAALAQVIPEPVDVVEPAREPTLRERGEELLERSRDVWSEEEPHPAYVRILEDLAPDEARILVHMLREGPQPAVDVRTGGPIRRVSSTLVASGLTMIGARAGVRYGDEVPAYLNNLFRLGLVWFSSEQVVDARDYQVLEAQPDVLEAMHSVRFPKLVRRSIHLTPFGINFCRTCLVDAEELPDLPEHGAPED
ncbi:MAG TPA: Abi-alpha family protein [Nocardioides sp.]|uniref:Abi-alpha family protein n=1 Tax=Nocardioides sp. TaxID=35761 RepID=UPI002E30C687|nr:Abi-alpha family protein [Nocardioides sp.]HEX5088263.1 Abi-alpha family protein [Nocardioides sp.]